MSLQHTLQILVSTKTSLCKDLVAQWKKQCKLAERLEEWVAQECPTKLSLEIFVF
jgi:hypothetical protein